MRFKFSVVTLIKGKKSNFTKYSFFIELLNFASDGRPLGHAHGLSSGSLKLIGHRVDLEAVKTASELFTGAIRAILRMHHEKHVLKNTAHWKKV